jgi:hypothetical protein
VHLTPRNIDDHCYVTLACNYSLHNGFQLGAIELAFSMRNKCSIKEPCDPCNAQFFFVKLELGENDCHGSAILLHPNPSNNRHIYIEMKQEENVLVVEDKIEQIKNSSCALIFAVCWLSML